MPLTPEQTVLFREAISAYSFPSVYFDFRANREVQANSMEDVETAIGGQLRSPNGPDVKNGLANVLYWGYAQIGYRADRVKDLNEKITNIEIQEFQALLAAGGTSTLGQIKALGIPQFSGMSFVSKVLMFLNPSEYCVLDKQIVRLRTTNSPKALSQLIFRRNDTQIRISSHNEIIYDRWRAECLALSTTYYAGEYRAVDIERGFFQLIQEGRLTVAQMIYNRA